MNNDLQPDTAKKPWKS